MSRRVTLLLAKGTFRQSARQNVRVYVKNALPGIRSAVENQAKVAVGVFRREVVPDRNQLGEQRGITRRKFHDVGIRLRFRNDQEVKGSTGRDVAKSDDALGLEDDVGGDVTRDDGGKNTH